MKRIILSLSMLALIGTAGVGMAQKPETTTVTISKPSASMDAPKRVLLVTVDASDAAKLMGHEPQTIKIAGNREVEITGSKKFTVELTADDIQRLQEKRQFEFGSKGFLRSCKTINVTRTGKESASVAGEVVVKLGVKKMDGVDKPYCESVDFTVNKLVGRIPKP